ncbi:hypothetical protein DJ82_00830, partial [Halorubrum sp. Ib24]
QQGAVPEVGDGRGDLVGDPIGDRDEGDVGAVMLLFGVSRSRDAVADLDEPLQFPTVGLVTRRANKNAP